MSYKTILVCLTNQANAERLTNAASSLARKYDAHLIGIHILQTEQVHAGVALHISKEVTAAFHNAQKKQADAIEAIFRSKTRAEDFVSEWRLVKDDAPKPGDRLIENGQCADLIIMGQENIETDRADQAGIQRTMIENSGRPVLVIPSKGAFDTIGTNVLVGWSATRESTRALHDSLPFLRKAEQTNIVYVSPSEKQADHLSQTSHEIAASLDRHGAKVTVTQKFKQGASIGDVLLKEAFEVGSDLIVTGGFGHSRFYDFVIGATTSHLLDNMTHPVLFSN